MKKNESLKLYTQTSGEYSYAVHMLESIIIFILIAAVVFYALSLIPMDPVMKNILSLLLAVVFIIYLLRYLPAV